MTNKQPENHSKKYSVLFADIDASRTKLPMFQRDFVWDKVQTAKLLDSIIKGYPVGTFIFWKTRDRVRHYRDIGNISLPEPPTGDAIQYVLDGQQRITSLYAVRKGLRITRDDEEIDYKDICIDLSADPVGEEDAVLPEPPEGAKTISVHDVLTKGITDFDSYSAGHRQKIHTCQAALTGYDFSVIEIPEYGIDVACDIFTRINTGGRALSLFEIMVAKTYAPEASFDLEEKYQELLEGGDDDSEKCLADASFETIPAITILQCISAHLCGGIRQSDILRLDRRSVTEAWPRVKQTVFAAIDHLQSHLGVAVSRLLPYPVLLVPFSHFFDLNDLRPPTTEQCRLLAEYFYRSSLGNRFTSGVGTKMMGDLHKIALIRKGEQPSYHGEEFHLSPESLAERRFAINDAYSKAILCLLVSQGPRNLQNNGVVKVNNSWLRKSASKNIHHIFPKAWIKKHGKPGWDANSVANIMIADEYSNQRLIRAKPPKEYITIFSEANSAIQESFKSHLVDEIIFNNLTSNDFSKFQSLRSIKILKTIEKQTLAQK